ncbi:hypothetical protein [Roseimicrobium sp. ORNL1]|uniref:hypothetical protein n=1 Tax=Roseimicrobium sp. ORNL1 TaxID=2711231 RepID=UPI0013E0FE02|nr:hypothetical protein [Roseimicrobium sp. ORNL1]QIF01488.1 hypothetical protein G5S37_08115 [Roseimicrobium sp. ORNL1]
MRLAPVCLLLAALQSLLCIPCRAEDQPAGNKALDLISQSAFCIAYAFRDADDRDLRPRLAADPFGTKGETEESTSGVSILSQGEGVVNVDTLVSRVTAQARVSKTQISRLTTALLKTDSLFPIFDCYNPHHAFVFYSSQGDPLCCIEICFSCTGFRTSPKLRMATMDEELRMVVGADLHEIARLFDELKLPLTPYKSFEELEKRLTKLEQETKARILEDEKETEAEKASRKGAPDKQ